LRLLPFLPSLVNAVRPKLAAAPQIASLEEHFGVRLFHRTTRKLKPDARWTDAGRPVLEGVDEIKAALGWQSGSSVGLARVGATLNSRFLCTTSARLAVDQPGLKIEFVVSDRLGDMIEDRLELALRLGEITNSCRSHASYLHRPRCRARFGGVDLCRGAQGFRASRGFLLMSCVRRTGPPARDTTSHFSLSAGGVR